MTVSAEYAAEHLSELFEAADRGEEVEIARVEKPVLKLVTTLPVEATWAPMEKESGSSVNGSPFVSREAAVEARKGLFGSGKNTIWMADDFDSPEVNDAIARDFEESEIFPASDRA